MILVSCTILLLLNPLRRLKPHTTYIEKFKDNEGARISQATEKIGFALKSKAGLQKCLKCILKTFRSLEMIQAVLVLMKFSKNTQKYLEYQKLYSSTLHFYQLQSPDEEVFSLTSIVKALRRNMKVPLEIVKDRRKLLPFLNAKFEGMDSEIYSEVARLKGAVFVNADYRNKFKAYLKSTSPIRKTFRATLHRKMHF